MESINAEDTLSGSAAAYLVSDDKSDGMEYK